MFREGSQDATPQVVREDACTRLERIEKQADIRDATTSATMSREEITERLSRLQAQADILNARGG